MTLLSPLALGLLALAIPIIMLYVLKLRRQEYSVASTMLWQRALDDVQANAPWQRLRPSMLLLLQLLVLAALVLALARPAYTQSHAFGGDTILIVDESFGMQAHDIVPSRFAEAIRRAHGIAADLGSGKVMSVIGMTNQPHLAVAESDDGSAVNRAIDSLRGGVAAPNFLRSLSLAASLARSGSQTRLIVLTSRDSGIAGLPINVPFPVQIIRIGGKLRDVGISAFATAAGGKRTQALARISNFGAATASSDLHLYVDGQLADVRPLTIPAGGEQNVFWTDLPASAAQLEAQVTRTDDVSTDKVAWAVVGRPAIRHVLLVSNGDYFMETALAIDPSVKVTSVSSARYTAPPAGVYDLVVFDGLLPKQLPSSPRLIMAPSQGSVGPLRFGKTHSVGQVSTPSVSGPESSLLHFLDLSDVHVARARTMKLPDWMIPVVVSGNSPLVAAGDNGVTRAVALSFNIQESDWPLRVSFPVAIQNMLHYLAPGLDLGTTQLAAGGQLKYLPGPGTSNVDVTKPNGATIRLSPPFAPFTDTTQPGVYTVRAIDKGRTLASAAVAVNFFPARSSRWNGPAVQTLGHTSGNSANRSVNVPVSVAWVLGLAALLALTAEWWYAFRR